MPATATALPETDTSLEVGKGDERDCVVCCRPCVTFCGRYDEGPITGNVFEDDPDNLCRDCLDGHCMVCGCGVFDMCKTCNPEAFGIRNP